MTRNFVIGIDPGQKGGIAFYHPKQLIVFDTPTFEIQFIKRVKNKSVKRTRTEMAMEEAREFLKSHSVECAYIEKVTAMQKQGVTGMFRFGQNFGQWEGLLCAREIEYTMVRPQVWKKAFALNRDKHVSLNLARELFPNNSKDFTLVKHEGRAEAALIAMYGWSQRYDEPLETIQYPG